MTAINSSSQQLVSTSIGDICMVECQTLHGRKIMFAAVYISINQKIEDIISFLHHQLLPYSHGGAAILGNRDYTGMWVRLGSTDLMAGKVMFLRSNQGGRLDGNESVADSFRSDLVGFKSWSATILGAFLLLLRLPEKTSTVGKRTCYPGSIPSVALSLFQS
ncbi:hypothetical protein TNCV_3667571 [Trichonephila clavipes]|nr:hypothetical protein TNCV_3667571 [Trichonephila clavipes]